MTANQKLYKKELNRIKNYIKKKEKEGFIFTGFPSDMPDLKAIPKRVTKAAIERVKSFRTKSLLKYSIYQPESGPAVPGTKEMARRRKAAGKKAYITRRTWELQRIYPEESGSGNIPKTRKQIEYIPQFDVLDHIRNLIFGIERKGWPFDLPIAERKGYLMQILEDAINLYDHDELAKHYIKEESNMMEYIEVIEYHSSDDDKMENAFSRLGQILNVTDLMPYQMDSLSAENERFEYAPEV